jgi:hypothetical protein
MKPYSVGPRTGHAEFRGEQCQDVRRESGLVLALDSDLGRYQAKPWLPHVLTVSTFNGGERRIGRR